MSEPLELDPMRGLNLASSFSPVATHSVPTKSFPSAQNAFPPVSRHHYERDTSNCREGQLLLDTTAHIQSPGTYVGQNLFAGSSWRTVPIGFISRHLCILNRVLLGKSKLQMTLLPTVQRHIIDDLTAIGSLHSQTWRQPTSCVFISDCAAWEDVLDWVWFRPCVTQSSEPLKTLVSQSCKTNLGLTDYLLSSITTL